MRYDIFCNIVDNFGDIGVCWRLAKQLAGEHALTVRLFIDDFAVASKIVPTLTAEAIKQHIDGVEILPTHHQASPAEVVIETFAGGLPEAILQQMSANRSRWINLDYLSAEAWVDDFHAKPSPHPTLPLVRHFFFPGFTQKTGGLMREKTLFSQRNAFQNSSDLQDNFWENIKVPPIENAIKISLFSYAQADLAGLFNVLKQHHQPVQLIVPANGLIQSFIQNIEPLPNHLHIYQIPFLSQTDYDQLLWACDLNFVRGEDSWVRAIWAAKPFIWQPYIQAEDTHLIKLNAFIAMYYAQYEQKELLQQAHQYWATGHAFESVGKNLLNSLQNWSIFTQQKTAEFSLQTDLASNLIAFANSNT